MLKEVDGGLSNGRHTRSKKYLEAMLEDLGWPLPMETFFNEDPIMECEGGR